MVARWKSDALAAASPTHTMDVIGITVCTATPRSLRRMLVGHGRVARHVRHTMFKVQAAHSLMRPWKYPKRIETGRKIKSVGF